MDTDDVAAPAAGSSALAERAQRVCLACLQCIELLCKCCSPSSGGDAPAAARDRTHAWREPATMGALGKCLAQQSVELRVAVAQVLVALSSTHMAFTAENLSSELLTRTLFTALQDKEPRVCYLACTATFDFVALAPVKQQLLEQVRRHALVPCWQLGGTAFVLCARAS